MSDYQEILKSIFQNNSGFYLNPETEIKAASEWMEKSFSMSKESNGRIDQVESLFSESTPLIPATFLTSRGFLKIPDSDAFHDYIFNHKRRKLNDDLIFEMRETGLIQDHVTDEKLREVYNINLILPGVRFAPLPKVILSSVKAILLMPFFEETEEYNEENSKVVPFIGEVALQLHYWVASIYLWVVKEPSIDSDDNSKYYE